MGSYVPQPAADRPLRLLGGDQRSKSFFPNGLAAYS
jgi:hypothetical protein